jgi:hypothetical protein
MKLASCHVGGVVWWETMMCPEHHQHQLNVFRAIGEQYQVGDRHFEFVFWLQSFLVHEKGV